MQLKFLSKLFVNESMCHENNQLAYKCQQLKSAHQIHSTWFCNSILHIKLCGKWTYSQDISSSSWKWQQLENRVALIESSHDALEQFGKRNNLVISGIPDSVQDSDLESTVTSILSDIDVNVESREVEDCHRIGKSNYGSKKTIIRFVNRKYCKKALLNRKQQER